jgi:hypothetical protein
VTALIRILTSAAVVAIATLLIVAIVEQAFAVPSVPPCATAACRGAPGPIAGAGLPILAVGYGAYWLFRRDHRKPDQTHHDGVREP